MLHNNCSPWWELPELSTFNWGPITDARIKCLRWIIPFTFLSIWIRIICLCTYIIYTSLVNEWVTLFAFWNAHAQVILRYWFSAVFSYMFWSCFSFHFNQYILQINYLSNFIYKKWGHFESCLLHEKTLPKDLIFSLSSFKPQHS